MYLVFDIGGTHTRIGFSRDGKNLDMQRTIKTPPTYDTTLKELEAAANEWVYDQKLMAAAGGLPGIIRQDGSGLQAAPHLPAEWVERNIKDDLEKLLNCPVTLANDTLMIALGEAHAGAGIGSEIVAFIAIGTGVGGCRVVNGKPDEFAAGFEPGHQLINISVKIGEPDEQQEWEELISGSGILASTGKQPSEISDSEYWDQIAECVALGLLNTASYWSPDILVVGGGLILKNYIPWERVEHYYQAIQTVIVKPKIVKARLADAGGLIGSLVYIANQ